MKLYWKVKVDNKWTFRAAKVRMDVTGNLIVEPYDGVVDNDGQVS